MKLFVLLFIINILYHKVTKSYCVVDDKFSIKFSSFVIEHEYIVQFKHFYLPISRHKYITFALSKGNVSHWNIIPRSYLIHLFPSDFDIVKSPSADIRTLLKSHPAIKNVFLQKQIKRNLHYVPLENITNVRKDYSVTNRKVLRALPNQISYILKADQLWKRGITGKGIKVAIFDTGLQKGHPHFRNVKERTNWTNEKSLSDHVSHGTFVAGIIASSEECLGLAPDAELHIFKVFTNSQVSYTSWFLDAFNYAMFRKIHVLNLSIGGPDYMDQPFVDKVYELSANKIIMISAIGNDGPLYGTLNNPGDQSDVIGVGGINSDEVIAKFSSRGMTTWELPHGYGRLKPDIVTYGTQVEGSNLDGGCRSLSGTSVASPVVAGAVALILSGALNKSDLINPSSVKQVLMEGATKLQNNNMFEQGYGKVNILKSMQHLLSYKPKITLSPNYIDFSEQYMWPFSSQPLYCGSMPSLVNVTILNGISVRGKIKQNPQWHPYIDANGHLINVNITYSRVLWPWTGWMAIKIYVNEQGCMFEGEAKGHIILTVETADRNGQISNQSVTFPLSVKIVQMPPRHKRILWDQYHNLQYPPGYIPRDNLKIKADPLDWRGDHIHTNFREMYQHLRNIGYYIDILTTPYTCFNASDYGTLMIVDPEEEFFDAEIYKLQKDVMDYGLSVILFADWYNTTVMGKIKFFDENTREWWIPDTGGANIPALNDLLQGFGISFSDSVVEGFYRLGEHTMNYASGTTLTQFPRNKHNLIISASLFDQGAEIITSKKSSNKYLVPIIGMFQMEKKDSKNITILKEFTTDNIDHNDNFNEVSRHNTILNKRVLLKSIEEKFSKVQEKTHETMNIIVNKRKEGRIAIMGDSNCIDSTHTDKYCLWLLNAFLEYTMNLHTSSLLQKLNSISKYNKEEENLIKPRRLKCSNIYKFSKVVDHNNNLVKKKYGKCQTPEYTEPNFINSSMATTLTKNSTKEKFQNWEPSYYRMGIFSNTFIPSSILYTIFAIIMFVILIVLRISKKIFTRY